MAFVPIATAATVSERSQLTYWPKVEPFEAGCEVDGSRGNCLGSCLSLPQQRVPVLGLGQGRYGYR
ncbi:MAG: hypothetical protein MUF49_25835 [Oculatellaceae cyanobacterium Prado106]|nr:hypothetical protein [Oculatellaceae cyanobacterium Prado106]